MAYSDPQGLSTPIHLDAPCGKHPGGPDGCPSCTGVLERLAALRSGHKPGPARRRGIAHLTPQRVGRQRRGREGAE